MFLTEEERAPRPQSPSSQPQSGLQKGAVVVWMSTSHEADSGKRE